jgi:23S rRNA pseudouridine2605 synthase
MTVDGVTYLGAIVKQLPSEEKGSSLLSVTIHQGKNRQVRKMCDACGLTVHRLRRVREGTLQLGDLKPGCWRYLTNEEAEGLKAL